ncbi:VWA domain-containing protein [Candidatus Poribacteria bacterium]|nr:VWA domain-containing protein [Candidatus Poribacteria bacterium]
MVASKWRKWVTFFLRCGVLLCAIFALANLQGSRKDQRLALVFLIDISESIEPTQIKNTIDKINSIKSELEPTDQIAIIGFSSEPTLWKNLTPVSDLEIESFDSIESIVGSNTDILSGIKQCLEILPENYHRRIILFSDGIHNVDNQAILDYIPLFSASDVEIMTIPLQSVKDSLRITELSLPKRVRKGQYFDITVEIESDGSVPNVKATLYHNAQFIADSIIPLKVGKTWFSFESQQIFDEITHNYQVKLEVSDEILENNQAYGVVQLEDKPNVLLVDNGVQESANLKTVIEENGFSVKVISANQIPKELVDLQFYDLIILANTPIDLFSKDQLNNFEIFVRDLGHGLIVIGGNQAYAPGGYTETKLEELLPVEMTPKEKKESVAIVFAVDTSGSMANFIGSQKKIELAIEAIRTGIRNLENEDQAGVIGFDVELRYISELTTNLDKLIEIVGRLKPTGGTNKIAAVIEQAKIYLKSSEAKRRHIILLSDGKSNEQDEDILQKAKECNDLGIGITTIAIGDAVKELLENIASKGDGKYVYVDNIHELPKVLMEAVRNTQNYIVQEEFQPIITETPTPFLDGITKLPLLYGYVSTAEKSLAQVYITSHENEPILVGWNYGFGKTVAWTSDVNSVWSKNWIQWTDFGKFWGQVINSTLPTTDINDKYDLILSNRDGRGEVIIESTSSSDMTFTVNVAGPHQQNEIVDMKRVNTRQYQGEFQMTDIGSYIVTAKQDGDEKKKTKSINMSYPVEYANFETNISLLKTLSKETHGIYQPSISDISTSSDVAVETVKPFYIGLLIISVVLFTLEMILRRFSIAIGYINDLRSQFRKKSDLIPNTLSALTEKKKFVPTIPDDMNLSKGSDPIREKSPATTQPQTSPSLTEDNTITRLLAAKKRSENQ